MAISNTLTTAWSALVEKIAQETSVAEKICGKQYQVDADGATAINISRITDGTIGNYTPGDDIVVSELSDERKTISLNQKKYFAFNLDKVSMAQSKPDYQDAAVVQHAKKLALTADAYCFSLANAGTSGIASNLGSSLASPIALTAANIDTYIIKAVQALKENNADGEIYGVVPWFVKSKLSLLGIASGSDSIKDGIWAGSDMVRFGGVNLIFSNSITVDSTASGYQALFMTQRALPLVSQVNEVAMVERELQFSTLVKGLYVFGASLIFPKEIVALSCTEGSEA